MKGQSEHKFVWSKPCNTYTLVAICEYCGLVAFNQTSLKDDDDRQELAAEPCKRNIQVSLKNARQISASLALHKQNTQNLDSSETTLLSEHSLRKK